VKQEQLPLPVEEILKSYKENVRMTVPRLAKKYKTTSYQINKLLKEHNVVRDSGLELELIKRFLKYERQNDKKMWPTERLNARILIQKCPNEQFWKSLKMDFELNSLAWFSSDAGILFLRAKYAAFKFEIPKVETHNMSNEKIGEDVQVTLKPKTLNDFLKG